MSTFVNALFDLVKEILSECLDEIFLGGLTVATAHLLNVLKADISVLEDVSEGSSLARGVGVCSLTEFLCPSEHVSLVESGKLSETLLLVLFADMGRSEDLPNHSMAHLHVD